MGLIGAFFARTTSHPRVGDGDKWLRLARTMTTEIDGLTETFTDLDNIIHGNRPRVHLIGDYNTGKTSFIKRLLIESGQPLPNNLMVGGNPTTAEVGEFEWEGTSLVDTPWATEYSTWRYRTCVTSMRRFFISSMLVAAKSTWKFNRSSHFRSERKREARPRA